jgi:hypothetical protein
VVRGPADLGSENHRELEETVSDWAREVISWIFGECVNWQTRTVAGSKAEQMLDEAVAKRDAERAQECECERRIIVLQDPKAVRHGD